LTSKFRGALGNQVRLWNNEKAVAAMAEDVINKLTKKDLAKLIRSVFPAYPGDKRLGILVDMPRRTEADNSGWRVRRLLAEEWAGLLKQAATDISLEEVKLLAYPDVGSNNADLPSSAYEIRSRLPEAAAGLAAAGSEVPFATIFEQVQLFLAPTEFSTTAPLKNAARQYGFRAATMPGFSEEMLPALRLDYDEVSRRVLLLQARLDRASSAGVRFRVDDEFDFHMIFDLRFRKSHVSSGRFPDKGTAGNLPSGETYIVPYEGEGAEPSRTEGVLPVQVGPQMVLFLIQENRAIYVDGERDAAVDERTRLLAEPAYGNMAELGFGVLGDFGLQPIGEILLDEKLGLHVAFGRSDHFGGSVGPQNFRSPSAVVHLDRIYIPALQPRVKLESVELTYEDGTCETILEKGRYQIF
jgi:hypothetical protein